MGRSEPNEDLDLSIVHLLNKVKDLRRFLRRAIIDHVSDGFADTRTPLAYLIDSARHGDVLRRKDAEVMFDAHAKNIVNV